ncbi:MAG: class I SAM-dependent methyltransferase [Rubrivivax sp.]|nr:class I SAM-dependent methyltransferase [Rubrivivax sp.]
MSTSALHPTSLAQVQRSGDAPYACTCCGGRDFTLRHQWDVGNHWNQCSVPLYVWDCTQCGLTCLYPIPRAEEYPDGGDWFSPKKKDLSRQYGFKRWRRRFIDRWFGTKAERFIQGCLQAQPHGRFLDVGCGTGEMLELAARHYGPCSGIEPSPIAAAQVRAKGFTVFESTLEQVQLAPESFDIILMDSVIEHVHDPVAVLKICHRALAPGGVVAMLTPKLGGPAYRLHGAEWNGFRHGWHTFLFTGKTLGQCMERAGFEVLQRPRRDRLTDDILILWGRKKG